MAAEPVEPPPSVLDRVMQAVRTEFRQRDLLALDSPLGPGAAEPPGRGRGAAARGGPDGRGAGAQLPDRAAGRRRRTAGADVSITVAARFGVDLASVTARVRQMVIAAGEQALGVPVRRVDIEVVDLLDDLGPEDGP